jgi:hypothetical protein
MLDKVVLDTTTKDRLVNSVKTGNYNMAEMETLTYSFYDAVNTGNMANMLFLLWHIDTLNERLTQKKELRYIPYMCALYIGIPMGISSTFVIDQFVKSPISITAGVGSAILYTATNSILKFSNSLTSGWNYMTNMNVTPFNVYNVSDNVEYAVQGADIIMGNIITHKQRLSICILLTFVYTLIIYILIDRINSFRRSQRRNLLMINQIHTKDLYQNDLISYITQPIQSPLLKNE